MIMNNNINITSISVIFKQRIKPGVYTFDVILIDPPCCGAVVGTVIRNGQKYIMNVPGWLDKQKDKIAETTKDAYDMIKEMLGD